MTVLNYLDGVNENLELQDELDRLREKYGELREDYTIAEDRIAELESLTTGLARNAAWMSMELEKYQWVSVKDRLPEKYEEVLVYSAKYGVQVDWIADNVDYLWWNYGELVTHWMPLPLKPESEE